MKTIHLLVISMTCMLFSNSLFAQDSHVTERTVNGETYLIDTGSRIQSVINKKNRLSDGRRRVPKGEQCNYVHLNKEDLIGTLNAVFEKVFPKERINELTGDKTSVTLHFIGLPSGKIEAIRFIFVGRISFSLNEIQRIEKELEKTFLKINKNGCSGDFYFSMTFRYWFDKYAPVP